MLVEERGPLNIFGRLRQLKLLSNGGKLDKPKKVFDCIYCASVWVGAGMVLLWAYVPVLVWVFAASAGACLITEVKELVEGKARTYYYTDGEGW